MEKIYKKLYKGMIDKDLKLLNEILDDDFILIHMTGFKQNKEEFLKGIKDHTLNYYNVNHENIVYNVDNLEANLTGQSLVTAAVFGGNKRKWRLELSGTLRKSDDGWKFLELKASTY